MYRINTVIHSDGGIPVTIAMVQKKVGKEWIDLKPFENLEDAEHYINNHNQ